jgi:hypothetical protein
MELGPSREAASCATTQELPSILWNQKLHYRVRKSLQIVPVLSQINSVHTTPSYLSEIQLRLVLLSGLFPPGFPLISFMYSFHFLSHPCYMPYQSYLP